MKISDLSIKDYFQTHSGEVFQLLLNPARGRRKAIRFIVRVNGGEIFKTEEFEKMVIYKNKLYIC